MAKKPLALIVDDEPDILQLLTITLSRMQIDTQQAENLTKAKALLQQHQFDICLTDMRLPDGDGLELIDLIQQKHPELPVALITAHGNMEVAIQAMKAGAFDFLSKPVELAALRNLINSALKLNQNNAEIPLKSKNKKQLIGDTPIMLKLKQTILKLARSQAPVFIKGESGTGKELVAKLIHYKGPRADQPFVPINCGAIPTELMESEFFGHKKGSFSGAINDKKGLFQSANGGTLFLDEIAELPIPMQVKLLRAIQEKSVRPVGSEIEIPIDVRILSASHKDLLKMVDNEEFRQDLFYRVNVIELDVPPLRNRVDDIEKLADYLLKQIANNYGFELISLSEEALHQLKQYAFPGNIRELENILERAMTLSVGDTIQVDDLNLNATSSNLVDSSELIDSTNSSLFNQSSQVLQGSEASDLFTSKLSPRGDEPLDSYMEKIESHEIAVALEKTNGNKTKAAELLGISFRAMRYKLQKMDAE
jgi:two-component system, NtrC family, response regulator PilR